MMPVYEGKLIDEEDYDKLPIEVKTEFEENLKLYKK